MTPKILNALENISTISILTNIVGSIESLNAAVEADIPTLIPLATFVNPTLNPAVNTA